MRTLLMGAAALLLSHAGAAPAQRTETAPPPYPLPDRLAIATRDTLVRLLDSARTAGLPTEPLVSKAAEGVLKGADDARIIRAVRSLARELDAARAALPRSAGLSSMTAAASAIHAGASLADVRGIAALGRDDAGLSASLVTLADLVTSGVPSDAAAASIEQLMRRGARESDMLAFRSAVTRAIEKGSTPEQALRTQRP